ncbi:PREDICTED: uncharacterized protein LOC104815125 [Tarenaya hassleriana]|uniref:uncharacterized protein LOC104815125 n=1 Tax=Tarenaya hassleriana TaxID=28532 RepID=UPI00053C152E|nr:PREDICTED: uncharacterized protein LOC104815125 [Tarenaya hassleriana]
MKDLAGKFIRCRIGNGNMASFWFDNWTDLGPLLDYIGSDGPRLLRIPLSGKVSDAVSGQSWLLPGARSQRIKDLHIRLLTLPAPSQAAGEDIYEWKSAENVYTQKFLASSTWKLLREVSPQVDWAKLVWFKQAIPRYSFVLWMVMQGRMPTRDRLLRWNIIQNSTCVLCNEEEESHDHLFFQCRFSAETWQELASKIWRNPPANLSMCLSWMEAIPQSDGLKRNILLKILIQHAVYEVWKERNSRIFSNVFATSHVMRSRIDQSVRTTLLSLQQVRESESNILLQNWYSLLLYAMA